MQRLIFESPPPYRFSGLDGRGAVKSAAVGDHHVQHQGEGGEAERHVQTGQQAGQQRGAQSRPGGPSSALCQPSAQASRGALRQGRAPVPVHQYARI